MAKVSITIEDAEGGIRIIAESQPEFPKDSKDETNAQSLALDIIDSVLENASDIEEHSLN